jgi:hypothetical protein
VNEPSQRVDWVTVASAPARRLGGWEMTVEVVEQPSRRIVETSSVKLSRRQAVNRQGLGVSKGRVVETKASESKENDAKAKV